MGEGQRLQECAWPNSGRDEDFLEAVMSASTKRMTWRDAVLGWGTSMCKGLEIRDDMPLPGNHKWLQCWACAKKAAPVRETYCLLKEAATATAWPVQLHNATDTSLAFIVIDFPFTALFDCSFHRKLFSWCVQSRAWSSLPPFMSGPLCSSYAPTTAGTALGFTLRPLPSTCPLLPGGNPSAPGAPPPTLTFPTFPFLWESIYQPLLGLPERVPFFLPPPPQVFPSGIVLDLTSTSKTYSF